MGQAVQRFLALLLAVTAAGARRFAGFAAGRAGTAAVEFAIVLPVALLVYAGEAEIGDGVLGSPRVTDVTRPLVDLVSLQGTTTQSTSVPTPANAMTAVTLSSLLASAATLMAPEPTTTLTMTVSAVDVTNTAQGICCSALVRWSYTQGGTLRPCAMQLTALPANSDYSSTQIPAGLLPYGLPLPAPLSIVVSDVSYTYQPILSQNIVSFAPTMQRTSYMLPRATGQVAVDTLPSTGAQHGVVCY